MFVLIKGVCLLSKCLLNPYWTNRLWLLQFSPVITDNFEIYANDLNWLWYRLSIAFSMRTGIGWVSHYRITKFPLFYIYYFNSSFYFLLRSSQTNFTRQNSINCCFLTVICIYGFVLFLIVSFFMLFNANTKYAFYCFLIWVFS